MSFEEYQAMKTQKKAEPKKQSNQGQTLEEYQAEQKRKKEERAAAQAKAKAEAAAAPPKVLQKAPPMEKPKVEEPPKEEPKAAEPEEEDWEAQADEPEPVKEEPPAPSPPPAQEKPKDEPKEEPKVEPTPAEPEEPAEEAEELADEEEEEEEEGQKKEKKVKEGLQAPDPRNHMNVVFIGHVDAGKSTTCGQILYLSGCVDERTIEKYQKEAKDKNRDSWFLAYIMDTNEEEKAKGKTVEVGRAHFETESKRFTILDAPGHKSYVPNMISGASQADIGVLIISARKGEFETGFERGGQTREHTLLAKTLGVDKLILAVNKMDDPSVEWAQSRYDEIKGKLTPFLKQSGFKEDQYAFLPISGLTADNIRERKGTPKWYDGKPLLQTLDEVDCTARDPKGALRIPMLEGFKDMGANMAVGKIEQGVIKPNTKCIVMPVGHKCTVQSVFVNEVEMTHANVGENVNLKVSGVQEDTLQKGFVLCEVKDPVRVVKKFKAQLQIIELPEERPVMTAGYKAVFHVHTAVEDCEISKLVECMNLSSKKKEKNPRFVREGSVLWCVISLARDTAVDAFTGCQQLGRFTLRDEGRTIAIGKITELPPQK